MRSFRQAFFGIFIAALTTATVVGGIFLAVSQYRSAPLAATETATVTLLATATDTTVPTVTPTNILPPP